MMQSSLPPLDLELFSLDILIWLGLVAAILVFGIYSAVLLWHWNEYSTGKHTTIANMLVYVGVGVACLLTMGLSALWYSM